MLTNIKQHDNLTKLSQDTKNKKDYNRCKTHGSCGVKKVFKKIKKKLLTKLKQRVNITKLSQTTAERTLKIEQ